MTASAPDLSKPQRRRQRSVGRALFAAALLVAVLVGSRSITDEGAVSMAGDMPRYLMDGVFLYDFLASGATWTIDGAVTYGQHYFARYPALSLGHHPPLLPISLVPFYALFGVSLFAARVAILTYFLLAVVLLYMLARRLYNDETAGWACLFFASTPILAIFAQMILSEMPAIALILAALNALTRFRASGRLRDYVLFVVAAVASLTMRQTAVYMFPAYAAALVAAGGWRRLIRRDVIVLTLAGAVLVAVIAFAILVLSPFNVAAARAVFSEGAGLSRWRDVVVPIAQAELLPVLGVLAVAGLIAAMIHRDPRILVGVYWIAAVLLGVLFVTGPNEPVRYSIIAIPGYCLCAASLADSARAQGLRRSLTTVLMVAVLWQLWLVKDKRPMNSGGYEEAARFVLADAGAPIAPTVLYSASIDTGYFVFFVRKHDPAHRLVVLRSDKLLTTSLMTRLSVEDRIGNPAEIYPLLDRYGTKFVVIEDKPSGSTVLDWLRDELKGNRFVERRRFSLDGADVLLRGVSLVVYEYKAARPPDPDAAIDIRIPLIGREIRVPLSDLRPADSR